MNNIKTQIGILVFIILAFLIYFVRPMLPIATGFAAKAVCSCTYANNRTMESIKKYDLSDIPVRWTDNTLHQESLTATSTLFGMAKRTAQYRPGFGCTLLPIGYDKLNEIKAPTRPSVLNDSMFWPYGDREYPIKIPGLKYAYLQSLADSLIRHPRDKTVAVLVAHKDIIVAEQYAEGFGKETKLHGWSMNKSIVATLIGILAYQDKINITRPVPISLWENDDRSDISYDELLRMNSGLDWDENYSAISPVTNMLFQSESVYDHAIHRDMEANSNENWEYSSGTSNILAGVIRNLFDTETAYHQFLYDGLIDKIGMSSYYMEVDSKGNYIGSSYGYATARDWAKLGILYLHEGNWNREQIFDPSWDDYVSTPEPDSDGQYGAHFWLNADNEMFDKKPKGLYSANGFQGQYIFIIPSHDLVVVRLGFSKNFDADQFIHNLLAEIPTK